MHFPTTDNQLQRSSQLRIVLLTDTLGDVNGVSRFISNIAAAAEESGRDLQVVTSTRLPIPARDNILNFAPLHAMPMPGYKDLQLALPPGRAMLHEVKHLRPDAIHISTPGPVGIVGLAAARLLRIPVLGVYHTDFPAYVERLFDDPSMGWLSGMAMRAFYGRFAKVFSRSTDYADRLTQMGIPRERLVRLQPGIDTSAFDPRFADHTIWLRLGLSPDAAAAPKVLYVGRISIEKDLRMLAAAWRKVRSRRVDLQAHPPATSPQLIIVGDGPYRDEMERALAGPDVHFLGLRHGKELSAIYASSDLLVFPSSTDTLGQVVMEAQASGLPVLVSDQGGPREVVQEGITGHVLPAAHTGTISLWADAIVRLLAAESHDRRQSMGASAHHAMQSLSIESSFDHFWDVHAQAVRQPRHSAPAPTKHPSPLRPPAAPSARPKMPMTPGVRPEVIGVE